MSKSQEINVNSKYHIQPTGKLLSGSVNIATATTTTTARKTAATICCNNSNVNKNKQRELLLNKCLKKAKQKQSTHRNVRGMRP